jgi:hypothetical protein
MIVSKLSNAKPRPAGNNRVRLEAARRTIEELESTSAKAVVDERN